MRSDAIVIVGVGFRDPTQMNLTRDNDVVNALTQITVGSGAAKRALPLRALNIDVKPLSVACTGRELSIRVWSMATQSEISSSRRFRSSKPANVSSLTRASLKFDPKEVKQLLSPPSPSHFTEQDLAS